MTVTKHIEEIKEAMCDNYCKHSELFKNVHMTDEELEQYLSEHCDNCPLNEL